MQVNNTIHVGKSREFEVMQSEKAKREVAVVTEAVGHAFECFDFVVDAFHWAGGDRFVEIGEDAVTMGFHGIRHFDEFGD